MSEITYMDVDEIREKQANGDLDVINGVISGTIKARRDEVQPTEETPTEEKPPVEDAPQNDEIKVDVPNKEAEEERLAKYNAFLAEQEKAEKARLLAEKQVYLSNLEKEKKAKKQIEEELERLRSEVASYKNPQKPEPILNIDDDEDDEFASEYSKKTRELLKQIAASVGDNKEVRALTAQVEELKAEREKEDAERKAKIQEENAKKAEQKLITEIEAFQKRHPELQTQKDLMEVQNDYNRFRDEISKIVSPKSVAELEVAIVDYMRGGKTKELAESKGIKPVDELEKYQTIVNLVDLQRGVEYDPYTGNERNITDEFGEKVRYRNLDEAYKVSHYYDELNSQRINAYKEVQQKLTSLSNAPAQLSQSDIGQTVDMPTPNRDRELISMDPRLYQNDPALKEEVRAAYHRAGSELPQWRGRKF